MRAPPAKIEILLPVWGERYADDFLKLCLPSLMAPGNLPALSKFGHCTLVLMAPARETRTIEQHPLWALLLKVCSARIKYIDDLISQSSSTVLTLAFASAIRDAGRHALETCFIPLVADYVIADGALAAVVERIFAGASGVLAGNFQLSRELAFPCLERRKNKAGVLAVPSKVLVGLSFKALHQKALSEIVNEGQTLKPEMNRLFWRVDDHCMVGRFFLMHMIAIHPETLDFVIAASSDYSFIPELCPSGKIVRMTDSDEYFVVECQPQNTVPQKVVSRRLEPRSLAKVLAVWATSAHYENARHVVVFHTDVPSPRLAEVIAASEVFVSEIEANRAPSSMPFRNHPVWSRALDHHLTTAQTEQDPARLIAITGDISLANRREIPHMRSILLGRAPYFRPWHPRWADVRTLKLSMAAARGNVAIVSEAPARVRVWLERVACEQGSRLITHFRPAELPAAAKARAELREAKFDSLILLSDQVPDNFARTLSLLAPFVRSGGTIVFGIGQIFSDSELELPFVIVPSERPLSKGWLLQDARWLTGGASRRAVQAAMMRYARKGIGPISTRSLFWVAAAGGLAAASTFLNMMAIWKRNPSKGSFSSLFLRFKRQSEKSAEISSENASLNAVTATFSKE
jgi:hypothetical protein